MFFLSILTRYKAFHAVTLCVFSFICDKVYADNDPFIPADKVMVEKAVADFVAIREKTTNFSCKVSIEFEVVPTNGSGPRLETVDLVIFEDKKSKRSKSMLKKGYFNEKHTGEGDWFSLVLRDGKYYIESVGDSFHVKDEQVSTYTLFQLDPWMSSLCDSWDILNRPRGRKDYWQVIFDLERLKNVQENNRYLRAEFLSQAGNGSTQVYFDKSLNLLPVIVKRCIPKDITIPFSEDTTVFKSSTSVKWQEIADGVFRPISFRSTRDNMSQATKSLRERCQLDVVFHWDSSYMDPLGNFDDYVFTQTVFGELEEDLYSSFE